MHIKLNTPGLPPNSFPVVLKKILEMPPPNILDGDDGKTRSRGVGVGTLVLIKRKPVHIREWRVLKRKT